MFKNPLTIQKTKAFLSRIAFFSLLCFSLSTVFYNSPIVGGGKYFSRLTLPFIGILLILTLLSLDREVIKTTLRKFCCFVVPFFPFLIALFITALIHRDSTNLFFFNSRSLASIIIFSGVTFALLSAYRPFPSEALFWSCSIGILVTLLILLYTGFQHSASLVDLRTFVSPAATIYSRCTALLAGIVFIGAFLSGLTLRTRCIFLSCGITGFIVSIVLLQTRSVLPTVFLAVLCTLVILFKSTVNSKKKVFAALCLATLPVLIFFCISDRMSIGEREVIKSGSLDSIVSILEKHENDIELEGTEKETLATLNSSMGGRMAAWAIAKREITKHPFVGIGAGELRLFLNTKKVFSSSGNYVVHFHSDYVQCAVVGGILLLTGLLGTILLLFWKARSNPILLFLISSMAIFSVVELAFCDKQTFQIFVTSWVLISLLPQTDFNKNLSRQR